ncbi:MgtC/SapB family protein [Acinetobacter sp. Marseille-Q1618]|uniref:MgtC/SapB family protein n=1 Tax=Acinetobacter sp. Marseille-Q1618 TaxID=2697502 RepID=UPI00156F0567|nr:MgtC/SapB family protein [Acinetobacter sp. Marseille-Q1618]
MQEFIHLSSWNMLLINFIHIMSAFILGMIIGFERQIRQRTAGLRTNTLVAVGAAIFVSLGVRIYQEMGGTQTPIHIVAYVISGIGFLGAGAIMKEGANISGLNTAATLWGTGAVGACAGAGFLAEAVVAALFVLASNTLLRPVVNQINRLPYREETGEASYMIYVICTENHKSEIREKMIDLLEHSTYPARKVTDHTFGRGDVEMEFTLFATAVLAHEIDRIVDMAETFEGVKQAFWNAKDE